MSDQVYTDEERQQERILLPFVISECLLQKNYAIMPTTMKPMIAMIPVRIRSTTQ